MSAAILDDTGWHLLSIDSVAVGSAGVVDPVGGRTGTYGIGAHLVEVVETSLYLDDRTRVLRQHGPGDGDFPVVDGISELQFDFFGSGGVPLAWPELSDGPLCGRGALAYDCDLLRIRAVRATVGIVSAVGRPPLRFVVEFTPRSSRP
jgi:hypothetical protein